MDLEIYRSSPNPHQNPRDRTDHFCCGLCIVRVVCRVSAACRVCWGRVIKRLAESRPPLV